MMEKETVRQKKDLLQQARQRKEDADEKKWQKVLGIMGLKPHHGPCTSPADGDNTQQMELWKRPWELIIFSKAGACKDFTLSKGHWFIIDTGQQAAAVFRGTGNRPSATAASWPWRSPSQAPSAKTGYISQNQTANKEDVPDFDADRMFHFQFTRHGEIVADYYEDTFHIGEVLEVKNEQEAEVSFMK